MPAESRKTAIAHAPGRVELLGNHTDYNEGVVLGAAIDRRLTVRGKQREDGMIVIHSDAMGEIQVRRSDLRPLARRRWANYALGVVANLQPCPCRSPDLPLK